MFFFFMLLLAINNKLFKIILDSLWIFSFTIKYLSIDKNSNVKENNKYRNKVRIKYF